jgi:NAD(P)-dependent dehydrogenase (short-subunit alcohol dehydrogenase family)
MRRRRTVTICWAAAERPRSIVRSLREEAVIHGKTVVITGATSGIGLAAAERLAAMGARLVVIARDRKRGEAAMERIAAQGPGKDHRIHYADLSRLAEMKRVGAEIAAAEPRIHVLINNAGGLIATREVTEDGLERTFATNHMAYFVLTHVLLDRLKASAPARIVNTASDAHAREKLDLADLQMEKGYRFRGAYGRSKLCNILFTRELSRRLAGTNVTANCLHPGFISTGLGQRDNFFLGIAVRLAMALRAKPLEQGAERIVYLASSPEVEGITGQYFVDRRPASPTRDAQDNDSARRLWAESARLAGIDPAMSGVTAG